MICGHIARHYTEIFDLCDSEHVESVEHVMNEIDDFRHEHGQQLALVYATSLWNWIDHQREPEILWAAMAHRLPWCFSDPTDTNSIHFAYSN